MMLRGNDTDAMTSRTEKWVYLVHLRGSALVEPALVSGLFAINRSQTGPEEVGD